MGFTIYIGNATAVYRRYWIGSVGRTLYERFISEYNKKMWLVDDNRLIDTFRLLP
jgi:UDP-galactopyranose mutase